MSLRLGTAFVAGGGSTVNVDNSTIIKDANNVISAQALLNQNAGNNPVKLWIGTKAQYDAIGTYDATTLYHITDSGGSEGTTDYNELSNQPQINSVTLVGNKTSSDLGLMSNANFLPANHVITVATDGSGDFTSLVDAVNYLSDKYSNGQIRIHILSGTYAINGYINLDGTLGNISKIIIYGDGIDNTILNFTNVSSYTGAININQVNTFFTFKDLTIVNQDTEKSTRIGINVAFAQAGINNCKIVNFNEGVTSTQGSTVQIINKVTINDCTSAIVAYAGGHISTDYNTQFVVTNATYGIFVAMGSTVALTYVQRVFNNVTNLTNITMGSITANGYIGGEWHT